MYNNETYKLPFKVRLYDSNEKNLNFIHLNGDKDKNQINRINFSQFIEEFNSCFENEQSFKLVRKEILKEIHQNGTDKIDLLKKKSYFSKKKSTTEILEPNESHEKCFRPNQMVCERINGLSITESEIKKLNHDWHVPPKTIFKPFIEAIHDFKMIQDGDRILIGLSGGKDSMSLLHSIRQYKFYAKSRVIILCNYYRNLINFLINFIKIS